MTLTPAHVEQVLADIANRIENGQKLLAELDEKFTTAGMEYDLGFARAMLGAKGPNAEARKAEALLAVEGLFREKEIAGLALRAGKGRMDALKVKADLFRSIGSSVREAMRL